MNGTSPPSIVVIQHAVVEGLGRIEPALREAGLGVEVVPPDMALPSDGCGGAAGLIVLGGPMGVYEVDRHPRLRDEMLLVEEALTVELPVLGVCLGSQLLAAVLGAKVRPGPSQELGWHEVTLMAQAKADPLFRALPATFKALHWHGDVFALPSGAYHLARSAMTECQAFRYGPSAWGILFHLEAGLSQVRAMATTFPDEVLAGGTTIDHLLHASEREERGTAQLASRVFGEWARVVQARGSGRT